MRKWKYGVDDARYRELFEQQDGKCAICKREPGRRTLAVDHSHKTRKVRGLLCDRCNLLLGMAEDDIEYLYATINYLRQHDE